MLLLHAAREQMDVMMPGNTRGVQAGPAGKDQIRARKQS
jgi:hypothetical protein